MPNQILFHKYYDVFIYNLIEKNAIKEISVSAAPCRIRSPFHVHFSGQLLVK